ncbi:MAG: hypothetical protein KDA63_13155 [Planctomycetales bacterium]|nr:hypothetical protein [Planctomycetales bacterium]
MSIDSYTPCPGGTGKKIKFCCSDLTGEFQKLFRMVEGEQYQAALGQLDGLIARYPQRACLEAIKATVHVAINQYEQAEATLRPLVERMPENAQALAQWAVTLAHLQGPQAAVEPLQRALENCVDKNMPFELAEAIVQVGDLFAAHGDVLAAFGHWSLRSRIEPRDEKVAERLIRWQRSEEVPLPLRDDVAFRPPPDGAEWTEAYNEALRTATRGLWRKACDQFAAITSSAPNAVPVWQALATLRGWLGDTTGYVAVLRRLATLDVPQEDAVDAELFAQLLDTTREADDVDQLTLTFEIRDVDIVLERISADKRFLLDKNDPRYFSRDDGPPPRSAYELLDRPELPADTPSADVTADNLPSMLGLVVLFGRETDRPPRVELRTLRDASLDDTVALLRGVLGDQIDGEPSETSQSAVPRELLLLEDRRWYPKNISYDRRSELQNELRRHAYLEKWPDAPLGVLDGKSPREAAADPAGRIRLAAHLRDLELTEHSQSDAFDFAPLRELLGLPQPELIDPSTCDVRSIPFARLDRIDVEKVDDRQAYSLFFRLWAGNHHAALRRLIPVLIERGTFEAARRDASDAAASEGEPTKPMAQVATWQACVVMAHTLGASTAALDWLEKARAAADEVGVSNAQIDLDEIQLRLRRGEAAEFTRLIEHLLSAHGNERGVREAVFSILTETGLIRPDGQPVQGDFAMQPDMDTSAAPDAGESSAIWTPESEQTGGSKSLWLPGSD